MMIIAKMCKHLYVHVPFCKSICNYCDFCHRIYDESIVLKWLTAIKQEIENTCHDEYETIYIGGGTPSCLKLLELDNLLSYIEPFSNKVIEYTIEINPETLDEEKVKLLKKYKINRVSIGLQSSDDQLLKTLNRNHSFSDVCKCITLLKKYGINNISVDLMYSLPEQTMEILKKTLDDVIKLNLPHISIYSLTIEENSVFGKKGIKNLDEDIEADMYDLIIDTLNKNGYRHYEISNFAFEGYLSKHNLGYWNYDDYLGIGMGASSKVQHVRYDNTRSFNKYFANYNEKNDVIKLDVDDEMFENIMMSLRTDTGIDLSMFEKRYNKNLLTEYKAAIEEQNTNLIIKDRHLLCTNRKILNNVLLSFMK